DFRGDGSGFQLGGDAPAPSPAHVVRNSAAWDNTQFGFSANGNTGAIRLRRTTAYGNQAAGYSFAGSRARLERNLSVSNGDTNADAGPEAVSQGNNWSPGRGSGWSAGGAATPPFVTTDPVTALGARRQDGSLPVTSFLVVADGSEIGSTME
ncbi:pectate lyase, partial [Streptomyces sp. 2MCAF27]